jgi:uncharacterized protein (TIGR02265 family)
VFDRKSALAAVSQHCDIEERLAVIPPSARWRGLYFHAINTVLSRAGKLEEYQRVMPGSHSALRWYPAGELLQRVAVAGAILRSPEEVHAGMHAIGHDNAIAFSESLLGRSLIRLLSRDPYRLLEQGVSGRRQTATYGRWSLEQTGERSAVMHFEQEYCWLESYIVGAGQGTFESVGVEASFEVQLDDPYNGRHIIHW